MKKVGLLMLAATFLAGSAAAQVPAATSPAASGQAAGSENALAQNTPILATLSKTIDTKKAKAGDPVNARIEQDILSQGNVVLPHGSHLIGHLTAAQAAEKGEQQSELGIAWDRAELKNGQQIPVHALIYALAPPQMAAPLSTGMGPGAAGPMGNAGGTAGLPGAPPGGMGSPSGGNPGGEAGNPGGVGAPAPNNPPSAPGGVSGPTLNVRSVGVQGMPGIALHADPTQGSMITGAKGNFKLSGGTQMVLRVANP